MLDYICGKIVMSSLGVVVLETGGAGVRLLVPEPLSRALCEGMEARLFTILSLKNEELKLYGFASAEDRRMFERLQTVSGIGPTIALNILSACDLSTLYQAILREDLNLFKRIKGVGQKTAQRIVLELKGSIQKEGMPALAPFPASASLQSDAIAALLSLGYAPEGASLAVAKAWENLQKEENPTLEILIREALNQLR